MMDFQDSRLVLRLGIMNKMKVKVYFNLHKKLFSVVALEGDRKGRVIRHVNKIDLSNCAFRVQRAGRERVLRESRKNVHAYISGYTDSFKDSVNLEERITCNPYKYSTFVAKPSEAPVGNRKRCRLIAKDGRAEILSTLT